MPPRASSEEAIDVLGSIARKAISLRPLHRNIAIWMLFIVGGLILYFSAHPFLDSMLALAGAFGVSTFVFVQWVAPFLSEFPEKLSAFYWARRVSTANVALMNMVSSNINQWSILSAMIPILFVISAGRLQPFGFTDFQRQGLLVTVSPRFLGSLLLRHLELNLHD